MPTSNTVQNNGNAQVYNPSTGTWGSYVAPAPTNGVGSTAPNYVNSPISSTTGFAAANPINNPSPITVSNPTLTSTNISTPPAQTALNNSQTAPGSSVVSPSIASGAGSSVLGTSTTSPTPVTESGALSTQAGTSGTDPTQTPAYQSALTSYNTFNAQYAALQTEIAQYNAAAVGSGDSLANVSGQEAIKLQSLGSQMTAAQQGMAAAQAAMQTAIQGYTAQATAENQTTTQTQPSQQTTQVPLATTVLGPGNTPIVTTPGVTTPGSALYTPTPTGTNVAPTGTVAGASATGVYTIKSGDTFDSIAAANGTTAAALEAANPGMTATDLQIGAPMVIPGQGGSSGGVGSNSTLIGSPYTAGTIAGQNATGQNVVVMQIAYKQAQGIHATIDTLLQQNPNLNSSPVALANAMNQWVNTTQIPSGPYTALLTDLQEYANTIAPVLGVTSGNVTDAKQAIANQMVPLLASGQTIDYALNNLETVAAGKIYGAQEVGQNPNAPITPPTTNSTTSTALGLGSSWSNFSYGNPQ